MLVGRPSYMMLSTSKPRAAYFTRAGPYCCTVRPVTPFTASFRSRMPWSSMRWRVTTLTD